jgi:hypothetical protein
MGGPPEWGFGKGLTTPHRKKSLLMLNVVQGLQVVLLSLK